jgi:hypothetical protein
MNIYKYIDINIYVYIQGADPTPFQQQCAPTMKINFFGVLNMMKSFLPLLRYIYVYMYTYMHIYIYIWIYTYV